MEHKSQHAFVPCSIQLQRGRCLRWAERRGGGVPFQPQSLTVVPLNINWQPGTRHSPWLAPYIWMEHDILVFYTVNACVGAACGAGFV